MRGIREKVRRGRERGRRTVVNELIAGFLARDERGDHIGGFVDGAFDRAVKFGEVVGLLDERVEGADFEFGNRELVDGG